ncbi:uncharacterized protein TrAtP1_011462 [Trichoderma atroviride]|uniref:uncharacterized protein n=1 Tax=Hypocrea atroviridis TaxID=63577 RepID=UPI00331A971E|nr:hypothetical protein TrAtP1_011462 [Trichoderma atroviride]
MDRLQEIIRFLTAAGGTPSRDGNNTHFTFVEQGSVRMRTWTGSELIDNELIADEVRPGTSAPIVNGSHKRIFVVHKDNSIKCFIDPLGDGDQVEEDEIDDDAPWKEEDIAGVDTQVHPQSQLAVSYDRNTVFVFNQKPDGTLGCLNEYNNQWKDVKLPAVAALDGTPLATCNTNYAVFLFYISTDGTVRYLENREGKWNDVFFSAAKILDPKAERPGSAFRLTVAEDRQPFERIRPLVFCLHNDDLSIIKCRSKKLDTIGRVEGTEFVPCLGNRERNKYYFWSPYPFYTMIKRRGKDLAQATISKGLWKQYVKRSYPQQESSATKHLDGLQEPFVDNRGAPMVNNNKTSATVSLEITNAQAIISPQTSEQKKTPSDPSARSSIFVGFSSIGNPLNAIRRRFFGTGQNEDATEEDTSENIESNHADIADILPQENEPELNQREGGAIELNGLETNASETKEGGPKEAEHQELRDDENNIHGTDAEEALVGQDRPEDGLEEADSEGTVEENGSEGTLSEAAETAPSELEADIEENQSPKVQAEEAQNEELEDEEFEEEEFEEEEEEEGEEEELENEEAQNEEIQPEEPQSEEHQSEEVERQELENELLEKDREIQPIDIQPSDIQPTEIQPIDIQPGEVQPIDIQPIDIQPIDIQAIDIQPTKIQPIVIQPGEVQPIDIQPIDIQAIDIQPTKIQPIDIQPGEVQPIVIQPIEIQPGDVQPGDVQPGDVQPGEVQTRSIEAEETQTNSPYTTYAQRNDAEPEECKSKVSNIGDLEPKEQETKNVRGREPESEPASETAQVPNTKTYTTNSTFKPPAAESSTTIGNGREANSVPSGLKYPDPKAPKNTESPIIDKGKGLATTDTPISNGSTPFSNGSSFNTPQDIQEDINGFIRNAGLGLFFPKNSSYVPTVANNAFESKSNPDNLLNRDKDIRATTRLNLYQPVLYCDDSTSMKASSRVRGQKDRTRVDDQKDMVRRVTRISTSLVPPGHGTSLQFINHVRDIHDNKLSQRQVKAIMNSVKPTGHTKIGTNLKRKILQPLIYDVINNKEQIERPILVSCITDGCPSHEPVDQFKETILECVRILKENGYPPSTIRFQVSQIGNSSSAGKYLKQLQDDADLNGVLYCTAQRLDEQFEEFRHNEQNLERWLLRTLLEPIMGEAINSLNL